MKSTAFKLCFQFQLAPLHYGVTLSSLVDTLLASAGDPAAVKAGIFKLFYRATSIASKLRADGIRAEMESFNVEYLIEVFTMFGDADADGISALGPGIAALVKGFQAGAVEMRALADAVFSYLVWRCRLTVSKPKLKALRYRRLKLRCDAPRSNFAFKFNLRHYNLVITDELARSAAKDAGLDLGRAVQVDSLKTRVESPPGVCDQRSKLKCDEEPLSNDPFNFNVRRYTSAGTT